MLLSRFIETLNKTFKHSGSRSGELEVFVRVFNPGSIGGIPTTEVKSVQAGIDWDAGKVIITPECQLTSLTPEQVEAVLKSAKVGQSWHAYQIHKKLTDKIDLLEAEIFQLKHAVDLSLKHRSIRFSQSAIENSLPEPNYGVITKEGEFKRKFKTDIVAVGTANIPNSAYTELV